MTKKQTELEVMNKKFDDFVNIIDKMADESQQIMPLAAESLRLTKSIVKTYKLAFQKGLEK